MIDGRRERTEWVRDSQGRFGHTLPTDERCPVALGNRTGYQRGCHCPYCNTANNVYLVNRRRRRAMNRGFR